MNSEFGFPLPWQATQWEKITSSYKQDTLAHALLFQGPSGVGKFEFAKTFAHSLICESPDNDHKPCLKCRHCNLIATHAHPDFMIIEPDGKNIKVDQIRNLITQLSGTAQLSSHQVVVIHPADLLNINAANALLKTLEEPPGDVKLILVTSHLERLPATIRSRCQITRFPTPDYSITTQWLSDVSSISPSQASIMMRLSSGAPLKALELIDDEIMMVRKNAFSSWYQFSLRNKSLLSLVDEYSKLEFNSLITNILSWISDLIYIRQADKMRIVNLDYIDDLDKLSQSIDLWELHQYYEKILNIQKLDASSINLNTTLQLEDLLIDWNRLLETAHAC